MSVIGIFPSKRYILIHSIGMTPLLLFAILIYSGVGKAGPNWWIIPGLFFAVTFYANMDFLKGLPFVSITEPGLSDSGKIIPWDYVSMTVFERPSLIKLSWPHQKEIPSVLKILPKWMVRQQEELLLYPKKMRNDFETVVSQLTRYVHPTVIAEAPRELRDSMKRYF